MPLPPSMMQNTYDRRAACLEASQPATLSERFLRQSVANGINSVSYQRSDAQNEARSYNSSRKHERSPRSKCIKEDEHMHSQKKSGIERDLTRDRCALATATCLQHPERPTWVTPGSPLYQGEEPATSAMQRSELLGK
jgi:hypothetical protein